MATRSCIGIKHGDVIRGIYAHWDGYPACNGMILYQHYSDSVKVNHLISMGDVSSLGEEIGEYHSFDKPAVGKDYCTFYARDRGEEGVEFRIFATVDEFVEEYDGRGAEYFYLYDNGTWFVKSYRGEFEPLRDVLIVDALTKEEA